MAAPKGNDYNSKLKDPKLKELVYEQYLSHLSKGKAKESFVFEHDDHPGFFILYEAIESHLKGEESGPIQIQAAIRKGYKKWEQVCEDSADGTNRQANTASLNMIMRNKFKWDKPKPDDHDSFIPPEAENTSGDLVNESN